MKRNLLIIIISITLLSILILLISRSILKTNYVSVRIDESIIGKGSSQSTFVLSNFPYLLSTEETTVLTQFNNQNNRYGFYEITGNNFLRKLENILSKYNIEDLKTKSELDDPTTNQILKTVSITTKEGMEINFSYTNVTLEKVKEIENLNKEIESAIENSIKKELFTPTIIVKALRTEFTPIGRLDFLNVNRTESFFEVEDPNFEIQKELNKGLDFSNSNGETFAVYYVPKIN